MTVDWLAFTPVSALIGGCLIGFAAALLMAANGRIMGASGILVGLIVPTKAGKVTKSTNPGGGFSSPEP